MPRGFKRSAENLESAGASLGSLRRRTQQRRHLAGGDWTAKQITLHPLATQALQEYPLMFFLHALGHRDLQRALELKPDSSLARYEWARLERTEGHVEAAVKDFERVVHDDPNWAQPHVELAALYFRLNRQEDGDRERATFDRLTAEQQK